MRSLKTKTVFSCESASIMTNLQSVYFKNRPISVTKGKASWWNKEITEKKSEKHEHALKY